MIGIVIVTHGELSEGFKSASEVIVGESQNIEVVCLKSCDYVEELNKKITISIERVNSGQGVVVFVDLTGASPYNQSKIAINNYKEDLRRDVKIISGINLSMLLEAINCQILDMSIDDSVKSILNQGKTGIETWSFSGGVSDCEDDF